MSILKSLNYTSENNVDKGKDYVDASYKYYKLKAFQISALSLSTILKLLFIGSFCVIGILFLSVALAIYLGEYFNSIAIGYVIVGALFLGICFVFFLFRKKIDQIVIKKLAQKFSK